MFNKKHLLVAIIIGLMLISGMVYAQDAEFTGGLSFGIGLNFGIYSGTPAYANPSLFGIGTYSYCYPSVGLEFAFTAYDGDEDTGEGMVNGYADFNFFEGIDSVYGGYWGIDGYLNDPATLMPGTWLYVSFADLFGAGNNASLVYDGSRIRARADFSLADTFSLLVGFRDYLGDGDLDFDEGYGVLLDNMGQRSGINVMATVAASPITAYIYVQYYWRNLWAYGDSVDDLIATGYYTSQNWLNFIVDATVALEGLGSLYVSEFLYVRFADLFIENDLDITFEMDEAVDNLYLSFYVGMWLYTRPEKKIASEDYAPYEYTLAAYPLGIYYMPIEFDLSYSLDAGGIGVTAWLSTFVDLSNMLDADDYTDATVFTTYEEDNNLPWSVDLGVTLGLGGDGLLEVPISLSFTNITDSYYAPYGSYEFGSETQILIKIGLAAH